ncbi:MAG TPA: alpha-galactosidase, partial [Chitinophagaceae bacterium]|nr:alpha-galactosidase [Chitinophagaceae bacterium]
LPMMLCSGGGGRADYGALQYFTEFWPSDNTNPLDRIFIQWGYSYLYPAIASASHVTTMGQNYSLKFRIDVAMMGKLGFDMKFDRLGDEKIRFVKNAVSLYDEIKSTVWYGDLYRLISPYEGNRAALMYVSKDKSEAVVFSYSLYDVLYSENTTIKFNGLDASKKYKVTEVNLPEGKQSRCPESGQVYSGAFLMQVGIHAPIGGKAQSAVFRIVAQ